MDNSKTIEIHETAFVTSAYRATYEALSKDVYAKLWATPKTNTWINNYAELVSKEEDFMHCLRNRFFLEHINSAHKNGQIDVLINFGSGFSMYPYLLDKDLIHIEIDKPDIIAHKQQKVDQFLQDYKLPARKVHYISTDFSTNYKEQLLREIKEIKEDRSSFILLEGVLFFLTKGETNRLFNLFSELQNKNDLIGSVSFHDDIEHTKVFKKLINFFKEQVVLSDNFEYQTLPHEFYQDQENYQVIDQQDYYSSKLKYAPEKELIDDILNESLYILKKI